MHSASDNILSFSVVIASRIYFVRDRRKPGQVHGLGVLCASSSVAEDVISGGITHSAHHPPGDADMLYQVSSPSHTYV